MNSYWVVALQAEAQPLVEHLRLRSLRTAPFPVYGNDHHCLVVSGIGKIAAAAATSYLYALQQQMVGPGAWFNVGIAGHAYRALGEVVLAHQIRDFSARRNWFPPQIFPPSCATGSVLTVDRPQHTYRGAWLFEMEAAGFFATATHFVSGEWVHCLKVISDNRDTSLQDLDRKKVQDLITQALPDIDRLLEQVISLAQVFPTERGELDKVLLAPFFVRWHFSVTQKHRLAVLLRRWQALCPQQKFWLNSLEGLSKAEPVLDTLAVYLDHLPVHLFSVD